MHDRKETYDNGDELIELNPQAEGISEFGRPWLPPAFLIFGLLIYSVFFTPGGGITQAAIWIAVAGLYIPAIAHRVRITIYGGRSRKDEKEKWGICGHWRDESSDPWEMPYFLAMCLFFIGWAFVPEGSISQLTLWGIAAALFIPSIVVWLSPKREIQMY